MSHSTYDTDFYTWTRDQARKVRDFAAQKPNTPIASTPIDWEHIAEEIEDLGSTKQDALESHLGMVIEHLLKLQYSPATLPERGWRLSISAARRQAAKLLRKNPGLKGKMDEILAEAWIEGREAVMDSLEFHNETAVLPETCPYDSDQLLAKDWLLETNTETNPDSP